MRSIVLDGAYPVRPVLGESPWQPFYARAMRLRRGMKTAVSGTLATMGPAVSFALAGKFAFPERPAFAFVGDGAMQMLGMNGLITAAPHRSGSSITPCRAGAKS